MSFSNFALFLLGVVVVLGQTPEPCDNGVCASGFTCDTHDNCAPDDAVDSGGDTGGSDELCDPCGGDAGYSEAITSDGVYDIRVVTANGCPNHYSVCTGKDGITGCGGIGEAGTATEARGLKEGDTTSNWNTLPAYPVLADTLGTCNDDGSGERCLKCTMGTVAIALNGVSIYSGAVDTECTQLDVDDDMSEWTGFDMCSGHSEMTGDYHYHFPPSCLISQIGDLSDGHSPQVGWAYDGFPIYGPLGPGGLMLMLCTNTNADSTYCLDECSGMEMEIDGVDEYKYRYYISGDVSDLISLPSDPKPSADYTPYTIQCYRGCLYDDLASGACTGSDGFTDGFTAVANEGVTDMFTGYGDGSPGLECATDGTLFTDPTEDSFDDNTTDTSPTLFPASFSSMFILLLALF